MRADPPIVGQTVTFGTYNHYNYYNYAMSNGDRKEDSEVLSILHEHVAIGAIHNSAGRSGDAPKCHPETRKAVQQDIHSRLSGKQGGHIWLTGPAGTGKTAIIGSVCDVLEQSGRLAATYYFSSHKNSKLNSRRNFITTLAYQLLRRGTLNEHISTSMLSAIRRHPEIFDMVLAVQADMLILQPFRDAKVDAGVFTSPWILAVDGIDECREDRDMDYTQTRQNSQLDVLRVLLSLADEPSFPFRIIIASRPETWIRKFFASEATGRFNEIFLDDRYNPDDDIRLFLQSHFSHVSRKHGYAEWPREEDLRYLVNNASGQFIYAATVVRFVDSEKAPPKDRLKSILEVKSAGAELNPFSALDNLYTAVILTSSPTPDITVIWLKGICIVQGLITLRIASSISLREFIDSLFESHPGQAKTVLAIPSLIGPNYNFYHKSFIDYLEDPSRSGVAFPDAGRSRVTHWLVQRISKALERNGPEVQRPSETEDMFRNAFRVVWYEHMIQRSQPLVPQDKLAKSDPELWLSRNHPWLGLERSHFTLLVYIYVHSECRFYRRCGAGCRRWRQAIMGDPEHRHHLIVRWNSLTLLLDEFCVKRIRSWDAVR